MTLAQMVELRYNTGVNHIKSSGALTRFRYPFSTYVRGVDTMSDHTPFFPKNLEDYAPWVATHGLAAPYGKCQCGCGNDAPMAKKSISRDGVSRGEPIRFISGHNFRNGKRRPVAERFWEKVDKRGISECWEWHGSTNGFGYGQLLIEQNGGKNSYKVVHRLSWELHNGEIPQGLLVCHRCDNTLCVNPHHLFLGDQFVNMKDMMLKRRYGARVRLDEDKVRSIRHEFCQGATARTIAQEYGVNPQVISDVVRMRTWKHVK